MVAAGKSLRCPSRFCPTVSMKSKFPSRKSNTATSALRTFFQRSQAQRKGKSSGRIRGGAFDDLFETAYRAAGISKAWWPGRPPDRGRCGSGGGRSRSCRGRRPCFIAFSATSKAKEPWPCPTSKRTPRSPALKAAGRTRPLLIQGFPPGRPGSSASQSIALLQHGENLRQRGCVVPPM